MRALSRKNAACLSALAALGFVLLSFITGKSKSFTVITYNVWNGFESDTVRRNTFVQWAKQQHADVIAFQELNNFTHSSFAELAKKWGHDYAVIVKEKGYPVGISSRYPITNVYRLMEGMHHSCLYVEIKGISFFVVHFSPFNSAKRLQEAKAVMTALQEKRKVNERAIILGDFNAFSPYDSLVYTGTGIRDSMYLSEQKNKTLRNLNSRNELDYEVIRTLLQSGFYDGSGFLKKQFEASYPTKVYPDVPVSEKIKIDHMLLSKKIRLSCKEIAVIKDAVTDTLSDHYPIRAIFAIP